MTALDRYAKLEAVARYLDARAARPREVVISFGERSLVIMGMDDEPIAHWPLASLRALGPADTPILELAPDRVSDERLVLDDREMSAAIAEVCPDLHHVPPPPPRRRRWRLMATLVALAGLGAGAVAAWPMLPDSLAEMVSPSREAALGEALAGRLPVLIDRAAPPGACVAEDGLAALRALADRLAPAAGAAAPLRLSVLDHPERDALALVGGRIVLFRGLIDGARSPEEVAGIVAHAIGHARRRDALGATLERAGAATLARAIVGDVTADPVVDTAAAALAAGYPAEVEEAADALAADVLAGADLPTLPYADLIARFAADAAGAHYLGRHAWSQERARATAAADTVGADPFEPALRDRDWIALGNICDRTRPVDTGSL